MSDHEPQDPPEPPPDDEGPAEPAARSGVEAGPAEAAEREDEVGRIQRRSLYRHPLAAVGGALILAGSFAFVVLLAIDLTTQAPNPYRSLVTFIGVPFVVLVGVIVFLVAVRIQIANARKRGERVQFHLRIEPTNPRYRRSLWIFLLLSFMLVIVIAYTGFKAYETADSVAFCADACHVMEPQATAHKESAHANVACVDCHIGPGGVSWVKAKVDGIRQLWAMITNGYPRPIATPVENLRSAEEVCEECHWAEHFKGQKFITTTRYLADEENTPWTISLLVNVGGGGGPEPQDEVIGGIHWHMFTENRIEYVTADRERQDVIWVRFTRPDGDAVVYAEPGAPPLDLEEDDVEIRRFDCMDCHNRPSHVFEAPAAALDFEMSRGAVSSAIPSIKRVGLDVLNATYDDKDEALAAIPRALTDYYRANYPDDFERLRSDLDAAAVVISAIYDRNFFPEYNTDYRVRVDNASHFTNDGCFRCHGSSLETAEGTPMSRDCTTCHVIVAQGASEDADDLESDLGGLEFQHPVDIGDIWRSVSCTQCHSPTAGY